MTISEIRQIETNREGRLDVVHLIKEGSFYHANDWSAWLMVTYPIGEAKNKPMTVTAKKLKDGYIHAFVGFPATSLSKYIPEDEVERFEPVSDNQIDVTLGIDFGDATMEQAGAFVNAWKESLPLSEGKKQRREEREIHGQAPRITRITDILSRIVSLPMEDMSPREAYDTLRELRRDIVSIF